MTSAARRSPEIRTTATRSGRRRSGTWSLTAPYGHDGAFFSLRDFVAHYSESDIKLRAFDVNGLEPALRGTLLQNFEDILATRDTLLKGVVFSDEVIDEVTEFMKALTDPAARDLNAVARATVPSALPVDR
jgi:cytochrome c peroxidase